MDEISYFDLVVTTLVLLLGLKGIINGFFKEIFGMLGIVGGVFIGSHFGPTLGAKIDNALFHFENDAAIAFTGFIILLGVVWAVMTYIGHLFSKLSVKSGMKPMDRIFGFVLGSGKIFFIFAALVYTISNIGIIKKSLDPMFNNSMLYPVLYATGSVVAQIDPELMQDKIEAQAAQKAQEITQVISEQVVNSISDGNITKKQLESLEDELKVLSH